MKRLITLLSLCLFICTNTFPNAKMDNWQGDWNITNSNMKSSFVEIPFHSEFVMELIMIHNDKPDRIIFYEVIDTFGNVLKKGCVSKENSAQITISISDLPDNGIYTIILTSPNPNDRVWSQFERPQIRN